MKGLATMRSTLSMFRAALLSIVRDRQSVIGAMMFPLVFLIAFSAFDIGLNADGITTGGDGIDYFTFVLPGILAMAAIQFAVFWTSGSYARMGETGVLRRLQATPIPMGSFLSGQVIARLIVIAAQATIVLTVGILLGADIAGSLLLLLLLTVLAGAIFLLVGFTVGALASGVDSANMIAGMVTMPLIFLSGAWFPIAGLPDWLQTVMEWLPLAPLLQAMRAVAIQGASFADIASDLAIVVAWVPVMFGIAALALRPRRGRRRTAPPVSTEPARATA
jgi:ABC-2 type transport system permease protein